ncbi:MAG: YbjN domain-containing protein [Actinomycetota bacterium]|nr:YbjN domain-containing protein [Actinomycetota bacterium]
MSANHVVQSHLECLMQECLEIDELAVNDNGSIGVSVPGGGYYARVRERGEGPHLEVYSVLLSEIDKDPGLLEKLNDLNARLSHTRVFWSDRQVVVAGEILGATAEVTGLSCLCEEVSGMVVHCAEEIQSVFGGLLHHEREDSE